MNRLWVVTLLCLPAVAQDFERPKHLFHPNERLTAPSRLPAREVAREFLRSTTPGDAEAAYVAREYQSAHNGVTHVSFRQRFEDLDVENAEWAVNIDSEGRVINAGGTLARRPAPGPEGTPAAPDAIGAMKAVRAAARAVNPELGRAYLPFQTGGRASAKSLQFARGAFGDDIDATAVWYGLNGATRPAWKFAILDADGVTRYAVTVDSETGKVLAKRRLTFFQSASAPRGLVFDQGTPQPNPKPGVLLAAPPPLVPRTLQPFTGDPTWSRRGWVAGNATAGNNAIAGASPPGCAGQANCYTTPTPSVAANGDFSFPLQLGAGASPLSYPDASAANLFYWVNKAHDWFYQLGFDEAAGNFQQNNSGKGGIEGDPMRAFSLYGAQNAGRPSLNNAFYTSTAPEEDGAPSLIVFYLQTASGQYYDAALDAGTIVHEYTHGVSHRLVHGLTSTLQGEAMSEAWSDFFALEFLTPDGAPADGAYPIGEYMVQVFGGGIRTRPYSTRMEVNPLTYANLGHVLYEPESHSDGEIWVEALWEMRAALIRQWGEKEGRRRARLLVIDGMKLSPPVPSMIDSRDAILLADQVDFQGASQDQIWAAFARRGLGVLALTGDADSVHIRPSFDVPSSTGSIAFYEDQYVIGETVRVVAQDADLKTPTALAQILSNSGDVENVTLQRSGQVYTGEIQTYYGPAVKQDGVLQLIPGDFVKGYYNDSNTPSGAHLAQLSAPVTLLYTSRTAAPSFSFAKEKGLNIFIYGFTAYPLPFPFPFFGKSYSSVWVHEGGLLSFDLPAFGPCADLDSLARTSGIAPMWMDLTTLGNKQAAEDVYVSQDTDSVTFRWAAETAPYYSPAQAEPVNFAATLYRDGRIQFNYGGGNRNLTGGSPYFGCKTSTPSVGLANGHETLVEVIASHLGQGTLENARTVVLIPPFNQRSSPEVQLEGPGPGDHVQGTMTVKGIAYDPDPEGGIWRMDILVDGVAVGTASLNTQRPDFCSGKTVPGCPLVGFQSTVALSVWNIQPGTHQLQVRVTNLRGLFVDAPPTPVSFTVDAGDPHLPVSRLESPGNGDTVSGTVTLRGYSYSDAYRIMEVDLMIDGVTAGALPYGATRNDVCAGLSPVPLNCPRVGFTATFNTKSLPNGPHQLALRSIDETRRYGNALESPITITVKNTGGDPPVALLGTPVANDTLKGKVRFSGYAWSPSGRVVQATLYVDGYPQANLVYGSPRPDVCLPLKGVAACPNIGFDLEFDSARLANGPHFLNIVVYDDKGNYVQLPEGFGGVNVMVAN